MKICCMCPILQKTIILISMKMMMKMHAVSVNPVDFKKKLKITVKNESQIV